MSTRKLLTISLILIVVLNMLEQESKKNFEKSVLAIVNKGGAPSRPQAPPPQVDPEEQFRKALTDKVVVNIGETPVKGNKDAKIKLIVFSDYQCPFSKRGADTTKVLLDKYGNNIMYVYKNLPLGFHPQALPSAKAALAAGKQGKYYEYHDKLFENQARLGEDLYIEIAKGLGLNMEKFNADRNSKEIDETIKAEVTQANSLGFNGTPGFALNGVKILGAYPTEYFERVIKELGVG